MANLLALIPDRKQAIAAVLLVLACVFALLPAFHHHSLGNLGEHGAVIQTGIAAGTHSQAYKPDSAAPVLAAAHQVESECKLCALGNQTPIWGGHSTVSAAAISESAVVIPVLRPFSRDLLDAAQPRAPPHLA
ncbi:MAG: hypothetical protein FJZ00_11135 [Candidatus Sericytochromatia bacterium]|uniref:DUF2946 domain-containing protein n=1 Tax=Candidatus Tanganyikabacteria bacterium TaxID=2961651 RepID=A0A937X5G7_9BACT|nr:hypothetical protein [Candidatus Tanganyikabacteria bacterium]